MVFAWLRGRVSIPHSGWFVGWRLKLVLASALFDDGGVALFAGWIDSHRDVTVGMLPCTWTGSPMSSMVAPCLEWGPANPLGAQWRAQHDFSQEQAIG